MEGTFIHGSALPAVRHELDHGRAQPAFGTLEGGLEGEQAVGLPVHRDGRGQFDADGRAVIHHAARIGLDVVGESRIQGLCLLGRAGGCKDGEGDHQPSKTKFTHKRSFYILQI